MKYLHSPQVTYILYVEDFFPNASFLQKLKNKRVKNKFFKFIRSTFHSCPRLLSLLSFSVVLTKHYFYVCLVFISRSPAHSIFVASNFSPFAGWNFSLDWFARLFSNSLHPFFIPVMYRRSHLE